jgi:LmbE family N-acetylglucosaminyl deacetylase
MLRGSGPVLVVAPHPDDEVLGPGATIARLASEGRDVFVVIVTRGGPPLFEESFIQQGRREAIQADEVLGVKETIFLEGFPAALLDTVPQSSLNAALEEVMEHVAPEAMFIPFHGDLHRDHRMVAEAALVAARPNGGHRVEAILAYETASETNWSAAPLTPGFAPNTYVDVSDHLDVKLAAAAEYRSQMKPFPHERSLEALEALARTRGATVGFHAAESFVLIRAAL